jgi:squalene-hopene/tetraprenyl-beta-curcumene cyclase
VTSDTLARAVARLLSQQDVDGHWEGCLSSSALSTATAVGALGLYGSAAGLAAADARLLEEGAGWLVDHQNADGGWGDTAASRSNISTTLLVWAALAIAPPRLDTAHAVIRRAEGWITKAAGGLDGARLAAAVSTRYGRDRTFSVPILTMCALAGRLGHDARAWRLIPALPFEFAAAPRELFAWLRLPVVSYALPALIAMGIVRHRRRPTRNPVARLTRDLATARVLRALTGLQPPEGGFLEATPLTAFVAMSLIGAGEQRHPVVQKALQFIRRSVRGDGSWPIDTHLATWLTTLTVNALEGANLLQGVEGSRLIAVRQWLLSQQHVRTHVYTGAAPGGWAWSPLEGGVPDADDTAGALLALAALPPCDESRRAAVAGIEWLLGLQNSDGGMPTFCRGWGALPFDRSGADLSAHAIRAWEAWLDCLDPALRSRVLDAEQRAVQYLQRAQRADGSFLPLWFGNQSAAEESNPTYGTARSIAALALCTPRYPHAGVLLARAVQWLLNAQNADGGWGGDRGVPSSIEETGLALAALAEAVSRSTESGAAVHAAMQRAAAWLETATGGGAAFPTAPIGLYFARLWYSEALYPQVFIVEGLGRAERAQHSAIAARQTTTADATV